MRSPSPWIPLESDGFVCRACPTCGREFKWLHAETADGDAGDVVDVPLGGYFCPYCGAQAEPDQWLTQAQVEDAQNLIATRFEGPMIKSFGDDLGRIGRRSGGMLRVETKYDAPDELDPLTEVDDMARVDFDCHPSEPLKIVDGSAKPPHCLVCGTPKR